MTYTCPEAFEQGWRSKQPFLCCRQVVPAEVAIGICPPTFFTQYSLWLLERATPNPVHCGDQACGAFIPPVMADGPDEYLCLSCGQSTCRHCRGLFHPGMECRADVDTQNARRLAAKRGWKECPQCKNMVEKREGCMHMTCRCGTQFCYRCGRLYSICSGRCR